MATVEAKKHDQEVREVLARATRRFKKFEDIYKIQAEFLGDLKAYETELILLLNAQESLERRTRDAEANLARVEREATTRLQNIEHGHRALIDRLSKKEIELDAKVSDIEKRERAAAASRQEAELVRDAYERKLSGLSEIKKK